MIMTGSACPVHLDLFSRLMRDVYGCVVLFFILLDIQEELGIHQRFFPYQLALVDILGPQKLFRYAVTHQLLSDVVEIRQPLVGLGSHWIQDLFQICICDIAGQRQADPMAVSAFQYLGNSVPGT